MGTRKQSERRLTCERIFILEDFAEIQDAEV
jgi:hypothetical protein